MANGVREMEGRRALLGRGFEIKVTELCGTILLPDDADQGRALNSDDFQCF